MSKEAFERKLAALEALRQAAPSPAVEEQLRKGLKDRNSYVVAKAAALVAALQVAALAGELAAAFERFLEQGGKTDPQCWAKNAIAKALNDLGHDDPAIFLQGCRHVQLEPIWGGRADTAATLRGTCALALVGSSLTDVELLSVLVDLLADAEKPVRIEAARAIGQLSGSEGGLLLRLKALVGDSEPEVTGQCLASLLSIEPRAGIEFVARFLEKGDPDVRMEAAAALAEARDAAAIEALAAFWRRQTDAEVKRAVLTLMAASVLPEAAQFLLTVIADAPAETAVYAVSALAQSRFRRQVRDDVERVARERGERQVTDAFVRAFEAR